MPYSPPPDDLVLPPPTPAPKAADPGLNSPPVPPAPKAAGIPVRLPKKISKRQLRQGRKPRVPRTSRFDPKRELPPTTEIVQKKALLKWDSQKVYNQMGLATHTRDFCKRAALYAARLLEQLPENERKALTPSVQVLQQLATQFEAVTREKVKLAVKLEEEFTHARRDLHTAKEREEEFKPKPKPVKIEQPAQTPHIFLDGRLLGRARQQIRSKESKPKT